MNNNKIQLSSVPYLEFNRTQWSRLRNSVPLLLNKKEIKKIQGINEELSLQEVKNIYLPLSRLLNFYITYNIRRKIATEQFLGTNIQPVPYIIGIAGSVAVGKSTTARVLKTLLSRWPEHRVVELVTTDGFLHSNKILKKRNIMKKKGFPQSYDTRSLVHFLSKIKSGEKIIKVPIYSHLIYDVIYNKKKTISKPDILILEGLNVLQSNLDYKENAYNIFVSDFLDFSIYVDAQEWLLKRWYIQRFLKLRQSTFLNANSFFHHYTKLSNQQTIKNASKIWKEINSPNLRQNILPTKKRANLILIKSINHKINKIKVRT
ncbi:type I pantothenate kinase [Blochmannia endosymbiont of Colobopsis nipponica]|uniref:type I pantothenate kinase n=1 Tax=Blochmannia endosymbiont of Colobopsis nipponica TaxID=2681987 RepID=UPI001783FAE5|nr:type I pantothenate kinase [Blochmannia endosymbiont of Colobopsis nipponica]QOI11226.1 type I pantothenate kinase [Blochmannia endosymbiont of Colobopsis nipponica]